MVEMVFSIVPKQRLAGKTFRAENLEEQGQGLQWITFRGPWHISGAGVLNRPHGRGAQGGLQAGVLCGFLSSRARREGGTFSEPISLTRHLCKVFGVLSHSRVKGESVASLLDSISLTGK